MNIHSKAKSTVRNIAAAVGTFERWLGYTSVHNDRRNVETIPPEQLDEYLVEFYESVTKPSGDDYNVESFRLLRSNLESFLRDYNYPYSIVKCPVFLRSQIAYRQRKDSLSKTAPAT